MNQPTIINDLMRRFPELEGADYLEGFDAAILGITLDDAPRVIYSANRVEEILRQESPDLDAEAAREYAEFHIYCAYVGPRTPAFVTGVWDEDI